jgi:hypothetical protein
LQSAVKLSLVPCSQPLFAAESTHAPTHPFALSRQTRGAGQV